MPRKTHDTYLPTGILLALSQLRAERCVKWNIPRRHTVEFGHIETVANVVTRMTIPSWAAQPGSLANWQKKSGLIALSL